MTVLVADVGGTNARFALVSDQGVGHATRVENDRYATFYAALQAYLDGRDIPKLSGACVAVAGPVTGDHARLTNRDWDFSVDRLSDTLSGLANVQLVNDLVALGHALPALGASQLQELRSASGPSLNDQAVVAGLGTGFNACVTKGDVVLELELGHASLPASVAGVLAQEVGEAADRFRSIEDLFSGRGLSRLHAALSGRDLPGPEILQAFADGRSEAARRAVMLTARLMGVLTREMVFQYQPFHGIHFAGGAARGILGSQAIEEFSAALDHDGLFAEHVAQVPIRLITDDAAALLGAARCAGWQKEEA